MINTLQILKKIKGKVAMKKWFIPIVLVICILLLSVTAVPASAGVEPSPFRSKTLLNRINTAINQLEPMGPQLERFFDSIEDPNPGIPTKSYERKIIVIRESAITTLKTARSAADMYENMQNPGDDWDEHEQSLDDLHEGANILRLSVTEGIRELGKLNEYLRYPLYRLIEALEDLMVVISDFLSEINEDIILDD